MVGEHTCRECNKSYTRQYNLTRHVQTVHQNLVITEKCFLCGQIFANCNLLQKHYKRFHKPSKHFIVQDKAFRKNFIDYRYTYDDQEIDFNLAQSNLLQEIKKTILFEAQKKVVCKVGLVFVAEMVMQENDGNVISRCAIPFRSSNFLANATGKASITKNIIRSFNEQRRHLDNFINNGSNWVYNRPIAFNIEIAALRPITGGQNSEEQPINIIDIKNKKFLYNPSNKNQKCFLYCIAFALYEEEIRTTNPKLKEKMFDTKLEKTFNRFNLANINFPISVKGIKKFLKLNSHLNLKINILYRTLDHKIFPMEFGLGEGEKTLNLLLLTRDSKKQGINHFLLIKDANKFLRNTYKNTKTGVSTYQKTNFCLNCLNSFYTPNKLLEHQRICCMNKARQEILPTKGEHIIKFKNTHHQEMMEYVGFLDFECELPKEKREKCEFCASLRCKCEKSYTDILSRQIPIGYSFIILQKDKIIHEKTFMGENAGGHFVNHILEEETKWIKPLLECKKDMKFSAKNKENFERQQHCYMCSQKFNDKIFKVRDHSHETGSYLGASCNACNLKRRRPKKLKIFIHNGSRFDYHFLVKALDQCKGRIENISVLPYNGENFRTISFNSFEFNDSLAFLQSSLGQLSNDLSLSDHNYPILKQTYLVKKKRGQTSKKKLNLLLRKSFFPYEFCSSLKKMEETKKCPNKSKFYSNLSETSIDKTEHTHVRTIWKLFKCENLLDYAMLYCKLDVVLLAEIFQKFRKEMHQFSGLDPAYYISLPSYSFDSMLKITKCKIELPYKDINMVQFLENGIRGGMSFIGTRILKPSSKVGEESEIVYIDANVS